MGVRVNVPEGTYTLDSVLASGKGIKISNDLFTSGAGTVLSTKKENISSQRFEMVIIISLLSIREKRCKQLEMEKQVTRI